MAQIGSEQRKWTVNTEWAHNLMVNSKYNIRKMI